MCSQQRVPSDASCVGRDSISLVNHEIKINHGRGVGKYSIIKLNQKSPLSGIVSHIVTVFSFHSYRNLTIALSEIVFYIQNPTLPTPVLDKMHVFWGRIATL